MKTALFWIGIFGLLFVFMYLTMATNPQRLKYQKDPSEKSSAISREEPRKWEKVYAEFYNSKGLQKTMEIKNMKGYFDEADRTFFLNDEKSRLQYGESTRVRVIEDSVDLVFGIYTDGAKP